MNMKRVVSAVAVQHGRFFATLSLASALASTSGGSAAQSSDRFATRFQNYFFEIVGTECFDSSKPRPYLTTIVSTEGLSPHLKQHISDEIAVSGVPVRLNFAENNSLVARWYSEDDTPSMQDTLNAQRSSQLVLFIDDLPETERKYLSVRVSSRNSEGLYVCNGAWRSAVPEPTGGTETLTPPPEIQQNSSCGNVIISGSSNNLVSANIKCE